MNTKISINLVRSFVKEAPEYVSSILEQKDPREVAVFLKFLPNNDRGVLFEMLLPEYAAKIASLVSSAFFASILEMLNIEHQAAILRCIENDKQLIILSKLRTSQSMHIKALLSYSNNEVGSWMNSRALFLPVDYNVRSAINRISNADNELLQSPMYVISRDRIIQGKVSIFDLLKSKRNVSITSVMDTNYSALLDTMKIETAMSHPVWRSEDMMPIVNVEEKVLGTLSYKNLLVALDIQEYNSLSSDNDTLITELLGAYGNILENVSDAIFYKDTQKNE